MMMAKLDTMDQRMKNMDQSIHAIRFGRNNCNGSHLTKDCSFYDNGNRKAQVYYSSGDIYHEQFRNSKKGWL